MCGYCHYYYYLNTLINGGVMCNDGNVYEK
jgi:hypothetical protein